MPLMIRLAPAILAALVLLPAVALARPPARKAKETAALDRQVVHAMHLRDRGDLDEAFSLLQRLIGENPDSVIAHRQYQEMAVLGRRNPMLVEAEYRHMLASGPDDPRKRLLHASAQLAAMVVEEEIRTRETLREIERAVAAAEADPAVASEAHRVGADLSHLVGDSDAAERSLRAGLEADGGNLPLRADLVALLGQRGKLDEAVPLCLALVDDAPWRVYACAPLLGSGTEDPAPSAADKERLAERLLRIETESARDPVTLQSLDWTYGFVGDEEGSRRLRERLAAIEPGWKPPLLRDPYLEPLPGGELQQAEIGLLEKVERLRNATGGDAWARVRALKDLEATLPESRRIRSYYYRELAQALRAPEVLDRDASRAAARRAMEEDPTEPSAMNEWAYMSALDEVDLADALAVVDAALGMLLGEPFDPISIDPGSSLSDLQAERGESVGAFVDTRGWILYRLGRHQEAVRDLFLASLLTGDGTVHGHLGRARYAIGEDAGAFQHLLRALALGTEDEEVVRDLALHLYDKLHVVPGGLDALVAETGRQARAEARWDDDVFGDIDPDLDVEGGLAGPDERAPGLPDAHARSRGAHRLEGRRAPAIRLTALDGTDVDLAALRGRVVVVDFWATWCAPCVEAMPLMEALASTFESEGVVFLALSMDEREADVRRFVGGRDSPVRVAMAAPSLAAEFSVEGIPATFVIDREGVVADFFAGYDASTIEDLTMALVRLLGEVEQGPAETAPAPRPRK